MEDDDGGIQSWVIVSSMCSGIGRKALVGHEEVRRLEHLTVQLAGERSLTC